MKKLDRKTKYALTVLSFTSVSFQSNYSYGFSDGEPKHSIDNNANYEENELTLKNKINTIADPRLAVTLEKISILASEAAFRTLEIKNGQMSFPSAKAAVESYKYDIIEITKPKSEDELQKFLDSITKEVESSLIYQYTCRTDGG